MLLNFLKNYLSTLLFIIMLYIFYSTHNHYVGFFVWDYSFEFYKKYSISVKGVFLFIINLYIFLLIPFYIFFDWKSKARIIFWYLYRVFFQKNLSKVTQIEKTAILAWIVKWFFAPLMIFWLTWHIFNMLNNIYLANKNISFFSSDFLYFFNNYFFYTAFSLILFFDVLFFTLWYLLEWKIFKNEIRSVEWTFLWWFVALASYPPINNVTNTILWWYSTDFPKFSNFYMHISLNILLLILMWIYAWASVSLWLKASNLTNRWIIKKWPYKYLRHPAYLCKNIAWWIWWLPILIYSIWQKDFKTFIYAIIWLSMWSFIYYLRAKTEENHLSLDKDYINYKIETPNMFLPKFKK